MSVFPSEWVGEFASSSASACNGRTSPSACHGAPRRPAHPLTVPSRCHSSRQAKPGHRFGPGRPAHASSSGRQRPPGQAAPGPVGRCFLMDTTLHPRAVRVKRLGAVANWGVAGRPTRPATAVLAGRVGRPGGHAPPSGVRLRLFPWHGRCPARPWRGVNLRSIPWRSWRAQGAGRASGGLGSVWGKRLALAPVVNCCVSANFRTIRLTGWRARATCGASRSGIDRDSTHFHPAESLIGGCAISLCPLTASQKDIDALLYERGAHFEKSSGRVTFGELNEAAASAADT